MGDRDRIVIIPDVSFGELKTFVADLYCHHPHGEPRKLVTEEEDDCDYNTVAAPSPFSEAELDIQR